MIIATITLYRGKARGYRWRMTAANGNKLCNAGEAFKSSTSRNNNLYVVVRAFGAKSLKLPGRGEEHVADVGCGDKLRIVNED